MMEETYSHREQTLSNNFARLDERLTYLIKSQEDLTNKLSKHLEKCDTRWENHSVEISKIKTKGESIWKMATILIAAAAAIGGVVGSVAAIVK